MSDEQTTDREKTAARAWRLADRKPVTENEFEPGMAAVRESETTVTNPFRETKRYAVLKGWRLHEDGINYVGPPPYHRCMTSEEFDAAIDREIDRAGR